MPISYFLNYALCFFGAALTAIASIIQTGIQFPSLTYVSAALAIKTLALVAFGSIASKILVYFNARRVLILAQFIGPLTLGFICTGFFFGNFILLICGIVAASLPMAVLNIISVPVFRKVTENSENFRSLQGKLSATGGASFLLASVVAPILVSDSHYYYALVVNGFTFVTAGVNFTFNRRAKEIFALSNHPAELMKAKEISNQACEDVANKKKSQPFFIFLTNAIPAWIAIGIIPLVASSPDHLWADTLNNAGFSRGQLRCIEAIAVMSGGILYGIFSKNRWLSALIDLPLSPVFLIVPLIYFKDDIVFTIGLFLLISFLNQIRSLRVRDNWAPRKTSVLLA